MPEKTENLHKNHRDRLKKRFLQEGLKGFTDYQALELLLFYCFPRVDTNPIAHKYLNEFGSLSYLFEADYADLQRALGVSEHVAVLLTLIPQISQKYLASKWSDRPRLLTIKAAGEYCLSLYHGKRYEAFMLLCFDINKRLISASQISEGSANEAMINPRTIVEVALRFRAVSVIISHNHPGGTLAPSKSDIESTKRISEVLSGIGIGLSDHIIVCGEEYYSFAKEKLLD